MCRSKSCIGNNAVTRETLVNALTAQTEGNKETTIFFPVDKSVDYEPLMSVMDQLREVDYLKIGLMDKEMVEK